MGSIKIGILGAAGMRAQNLVRLLSRPEEGVTVTAVADSNLAALREKFGWLPGRVCGSPAELFAADIDAVVISTPDWLHEEHACAALAAGKHVYLEKPMAITPAECDRIMTAAREAGKVLYVGHNLRHFTVIKQLKSLVDHGVVGEVRAVWCRHFVNYGRSAYFQEGRWHQKRANSGGLLIHKGAHDLDVIHWLGGARSTRVVAMGNLAMWGTQPGKPDVEDLSAVLMQLQNGVQATYSQCHFALRAAREYVVLGTAGTLQNDGDHPSHAVVRLFEKGNAVREWKFADEAGFHGDADRRIVNEFIGVLRGEVKPTISIEEAAWAVKAGYAATKSLRNGNIPIDVV